MQHALSTSPAYAAMLAAVGSFTHLTKLSLSAPWFVPPSDATDSRHGDSIAMARSSGETTVPQSGMHATLASLSLLQELNIIGIRTPVAVVLQDVLLMLTALTSITWSAGGEVLCGQNVTEHTIPIELVVGFFKGLSQLPSLKHLVVDGGGVLQANDDEALCIEFEKLVSLTFLDMKLSPGPSKLDHEFSSLSTVEIMRLYIDPIRGKEVMEFWGLLNQEKARFNGRFGGAINKLTCLQELYLSEQFTPVENLLASVSCLKMLRCLVAGEFCDCGGAGAVSQLQDCYPQLAPAIQQLTSLESLELGACSFKADRVGDVVAAICGMTRLTKLYLSGLEFDDNLGFCAEFSVHVHRLDWLQSLCLSLWFFSDYPEVFGTFCAALRGLKRLNELQFFVGLSDAGVVVLCEHLSGILALTSLHLGNNVVGVRGIAAVVEVAKSMPRLSNVNVDCQIGEDCMGVSVSRKREGGSIASAMQRELVNVFGEDWESNQKAVEQLFVCL